MIVSGFCRSDHIHVNENIVSGTKTLLICYIPDYNPTEVIPDAKVTRSINRTSVPCTHYNKCVNWVTNNAAPLLEKIPSKVLPNRN